jgi:hypothetical protein
VLADIVRLASAAREQCFTWGPREHQSTYDRIIAAAMRYSAVMNYARAVEIPLLPRYPASSSSSASTAASQPTPATFAGGFSASRAQQQPQAQGPHTYVQWPFVPRRRYFQWTLFSTNAHNYCVFVIILYSNRIGRPPSFPTAGPRQQELSPIYALGGSRPPAIQFLAEDIPSSSTLPMFQSTIDTTTEEHLG